MTKSKITKRALLLSALSLLMCISMLIGSTFAWFTDTASTGVNTIQSGTLDVALVDSDGKSLEGQKLTFKTADNRAQEQILWEPGCTYEINPVYVKNNGSLALKYTIVINGIDGDAKLLEAIEWSVMYGVGEEAVKLDLATFEDYLTAKGTDKDTSEAIILIGYMKKDAGNDYQNLTVEGLGITVYATQYTYENDSNDNQYDENAKYDLPIKVGNEAELVAALEAATPGTVIDANGVKTDMSTIATPSGAYTVLDLNAGTTVKGLTLTFGSNQPIKTNNEAQSSGKIVFENCTFLSTGFTNSVYFQSGVDAADTKLVFNNCTFAAAKVVVADNSGGGVEFNNCTFNLNDSGYGLVQCMGGNHTFNNCEFNIAGSKSIGSSSITKYGYINLYTENYNTTVTLNQCKNVPSVHRYGNGTNTFVNNP